MLVVFGNEVKIDYVYFNKTITGAVSIDISLTVFGNTKGTSWLCSMNQIDGYQLLFS